MNDFFWRPYRPQMSFTATGFDVTSSEGIVEPGLEPEPFRDRHRFRADPRLGSAAAAVTEHDRSHSVGRRRHRMAIEQECAPEPVHQ